MSQVGEDIVLRLEHQNLPVHLLTNARARRLGLRADPVKGRVVLVKPRRVSKAAAIAFAIDKADWIADCLAALLPPIPFADGTTVPFLDEPHVIRHVPDARRGVWRKDGGIYVSGSSTHLPQWVGDWFREEARRLISPVAHDLAGRLGKRVTHISVRDPKSRWGSCSQEGRLSFSWRLVMAPDHVLRYVVAHEIAHLRELNHSDRFWQTVDDLTEQRGEATRWIKLNGAKLYRYGPVR